MELIGKQYEADKAKLEKIRLLLVHVTFSRMCHVMFIHSVCSSAKIVGKEISAEENIADCCYRSHKQTDQEFIRGEVHSKCGFFFLFANKKLV